MHRRHMLNYMGPRVGDNDLLGLAAIGKIFGGGDDAAANPTAGTWEFSGVADKKVALQWQTSHQQSRTDRSLRPHLHLFFTTQAASASSQWKLQLNYAVINGETAADYGSFSYEDTITVSTPTSITANKALHKIAYFADLNIAGLTSSTIINGVLTRLGSTDSDDSTIPLASLDLHYTSDGFGYSVR